jgi:hypothetical protein
MGLPRHLIFKIFMIENIIIANRQHEANKRIFDTEILIFTTV